MHISRRVLVPALAVAVLALGAVPAFATHHASPAADDPVTPAQHSLLIDVFTGKEQIPTPKAGVYTTTMVPARWGIDLGATTTVTVYNYTPSAHSIVAPDLGINVTIKPGKKIDKPFAGETAAEKTNGVVPSVTTFTATGSAQGAYAWQSTQPYDADKWGMSGVIVVN